MDIRETSVKDKELIIGRINKVLLKLISDIKTISEDMDSDVLTTQASAVWIGNNLCNWYDTFLNEMRKLDMQQRGIQAEMQEAELIKPEEEQGVIIQ